MSTCVFFLLQSALLFLGLITWPIMGFWAKPISINSLGNETDRLALLAFKHQITHDPQQVLNSWNTSLHFCNWHGVSCGHRHQRVVGLDINSHGLVGTLSPHIGNLSFLHSINLENNSFYGEIPSEVGHLFRLRELKMSNNSFAGEIPISLSNCSNLLIIFLDYNNLTGMIPKEIGCLSKLTVLFLDHNDLIGMLPPSFGNFSHLMYFFATSNNLNGSIPDSFGQMKSLQVLELSLNMFSSAVPPSVYNLSLLKVFSASMNQIYGRIPPNIDLTLTHLRVFLIGGNHFSGFIPMSLFNCSKLQELELSENHFIGQVPTKVGSLQDLQWLNMHSNQLGSGQADDTKFLSYAMNCSSLRVLDVDSNKLGGALHITKANFSSQLKTLYLGKNQISGIIPSEIANFVNLIALDLHGNQLTGGIPIGIGKLQNLQELGLGENKLSGQIPSSLGTLSELFYLNLSNNNFEGDIVPSISNCRLLQILDLSGNHLSGVIPNKILSLPLLHLYLNHNSLIGPLPLEIGSQENLINLYVSDNKLTGIIPITLGNCLSLEVLSLSGNFFQGSIPPSFNHLKEIRTLDLSMNNISGKIPLYLQNLSSLQNLNLSFNDLEGEVPVNGVFQNASAFSVLGNNHLCGGIPQLHLLGCPNQNSNKRRTSLALKVSLAVTLSMTVLVSSLLLFLCRRRSPSKKPHPKHFWEDHFQRVSYTELHKATDGFASTNLIGKGSFGSVYKGVIPGDKEPIAVKVLNLFERYASKSFMAECEALRKILHRNLLKILTACSTVDFQGSDFKALIFKFMPNGSLENWLHPSSDGRRDQLGSLNLSQRINIAIDIASALDYLHNRCETPIVHCDLKPSNILLDEEMVAHVGDFGLSKFVQKSGNDSDKNETSSLPTKGTIGYIPPEYGMGVKASTQGDVYSLGILMLEMITGKRPTNDMFKDGLDLHHFSLMALPEQVIKIVDPHMRMEEVTEAIQVSSEIQRDMRDVVQECLTSIVGVGVACSMESASGRMEIKDALKELLSIKELYLRNTINEQR